MYPLPYLLITIMFKDPAPVNQHLLVQAQAMAQQCGATLQTNKRPAAAPTTYLTAFDDAGSFVAYKLKDVGVLPATPLIKSAADPYKSWMMSSAFMSSIMRGQSNWDRIEYALYGPDDDEPSLTSERDMSKVQMHNDVGWGHPKTCLPSDIGDMYIAMMNMVSFMSDTAPDERVTEFRIEGE